MITYLWIFSLPSLSLPEEVEELGLGEVVPKRRGTRGRALGWASPPRRTGGLAGGEELGHQLVLVADQDRQ